SAYFSAALRANCSPRRVIALTPNTATATLTTTRPVRSLRARRSPHAFFRIIGSTVPKPIARALAIRTLGGNPGHVSLVEVLGRRDAALRVGVVRDQGQRLAAALRRVGGRVGVERGLPPGQPRGEQLALQAPVVEIVQVVGRLGVDGAELRDGRRPVPRSERLVPGLVERESLRGRLRHGGL